MDRPAALTPNETAELWRHFQRRRVVTRLLGAVPLRPGGVGFFVELLPHGTPPTK